MKIKHQNWQKKPKKKRTKRKLKKKIANRQNLKTKKRIKTMNYEKTI